MRYAGEECPKTGLYRLVGADGRIVGRIYVGAGEPFPPTAAKDLHYEIDF